MRSDSEYKVGVKVEYPKTIRGKKCDICHSYTPKGSPYVLVGGVWSCCSEKCKELALLTLA